MNEANWPGAILFDLDGTLVDSAADIATALNLLLGEKNLPGFSNDAVTQMVGGGVQLLIERALKAHGQEAGRDRIAALASRFLEIYTPRAADRTKLFPGVRDLLKSFHEGGIGLGVCTNKPEGVSRMILDALGVAHLFGAVVGGDTLAVKKPDPAPLLAALESLKCPPQCALMVGDSAADANAARAGGLRVILVTFGYTQTPVRELENDGIIESFAQLPEAITALRAPRS